MSVYSLDAGEEIEVPVPLPADLAGVVDAGVEEGTWSEAEGLVLALQVLVGEADAATAAEFSSTTRGGATAVARRAQRVASDPGTDADVAAELERLLAIVMPPLELREAVAESSPQALGPRRDTARIEVAYGPQASRCATIQAEGYAQGLDVGSECYRMIESNTSHGAQRVFYPASWDEQDRVPRAQAALDAMVRATDTYAQWGKVGPTDVVFSLTDNAKRDRGVQMGFDTISEPCPIAIFPASDGDSGPVFRQVVAHEVFHCFQDHNMDTSNWGAVEWFMESGADYFSNVVFPSANLEHESNSTFDIASLTTPLAGMSYETWMFWQYLANHGGGPPYVAGLHQVMSIAGSGVDALAAEPDMDRTFQRFVMTWIGPGVRDASGEMVRGRAVLTKPEIEDVGKRAQESKRFIATRIGLTYDEEKRFVQEDITITDDIQLGWVENAKRRDLSAWTGFVPEIRSFCDRDARYVAVTTTIDDPIEFEFEVKTMEEALCDPCLLGAWEIDLGTYGEFINQRIQSHPDAPPGFGLEIVGGRYYASFDDEGVVGFHRRAYTTVMTGLPAEITLTSTGPEIGDYTADGETLTIENLVADYDVASSMPGFDGNTEVQAGAFAEDAPYECTDEDLTIEIAGGTIELTRVEEIPDPEPLEAQEP